MSFERDHSRYIVIKRSDITHDQYNHLMSLLGSQEIPTRECVVVESDWPEYETVWDMIQGRVEGEAAELCPNCDAPLPQGCGGIFADDGNVCHGFGRDVPLGVMPLADVDFANAELRVIASNPSLAAPYGEDDSIMQFDDPYQVMAFLLWKDVD